MRKQNGRAGPSRWASLLRILRYPWVLIRRPGQWIVTLASWLWRAVVKAWRFAGRVGLAQRRLLFWLVWEPFLYITTPFRKLGLRAWRLLGGMGLAFRQLLSRVVWRPAAWLYRKVLDPPLSRIWTVIRRTLLRKWQDGATERARYRRRFNSRWRLFRARFRIFLRRPKAPGSAITAPRVPRSPAAAGRPMRLATALISVAIVLAFSLATLQDRQPSDVAAESVVVVVTSTPTPVTPVPTPKPTIEIILTPWPTPDPLEGGGILAFDYHLNGNGDIYLLPVGQSQLIRLTSHPAEDREPAWNPNGQEIAFASSRDGNWEIYVYNFPRGQLRRITNDMAFDGNPGWSPDGQWLVYESYQANNLDVYIIKADGSEGPFQLTTNPAQDYAPVWSPGGRHIAFTSWRSGSKDIFVLSLDDASDDVAANATNSGANEDDPAFSPDGRNLAFTVSEAELELPYSVPLAADYTVAGPPISLGQQGRHPTWSPDGKSLVYTYEQRDKYFLVAGSPDAWGVAPQAFAADGRLGNPSWSALNLPASTLSGLGSIDPQGETPPLFVEALATAEADKPPVKLWEIPVSAPSPYLSDQVDQSFLALKQRVAELAGWDFLGRLDNMFVAKESRPLPGQSNRSWNKAGRAFDIYYREALSFEPRLEVVREETGAGTYWRIYVRTEAQDGSQGEPMRAFSWDFQSRYGNEPRFYDQGGRLKEAIPAGYYIDFTAVAADYGWDRVPVDENWRSFFPAIRFWHFENRQGLTWEQAMLQLYTVEELGSLR